MHEPQRRYQAEKPKRSLSSNLTWGLLIPVLLSTTFLSAVMYYEYSRIQYQKLVHRADEHIERLALILPGPMWSYDDVNIRTIGSELAHNPVIAKILITDTNGDVLFEHSTSQTMDGMIKRQRDIVNKGQVIGRVEIALSDQGYRAELSRFLQLVLSLLGLVLVLILAVTGFLFRILLRGPLNKLHQAIEDVAAGRLENDPTQTEYQEFSGIVARFNYMATQVREREESLRLMNRELEAEILQRIKIQQALQKSEAILRATLESTEDGVLVLSNDRTISHFNARFREIWPIPDEVLAQGDIEKERQWIAPLIEDSDQVMQKTRELDDLPDPAADIIKFKSGRYIERFSYPLSGEAGHSGRVWFYRDVTQRIESAKIQKKLESQLRQSQKMEAIGTLAGGISHDFNNILSAIMGYVELAKQKYAGDGELGSYLGNILKSTERARDLVRQILTFSRQTDHQATTVRLEEVIRENAPMIQSLIPATISMETKINSPATVMADVTQMHQVLMNLWTNASHAMNDTGGVLTTELDKVEHNAESGPAPPGLKDGEYARIQVSDTGVGIPAEIMERIFEPFFTTRSKGVGTGMGLSVVHGIIKSHGGDITVESKPGQGTRFSIYLPLATERQLTETRESEEEGIQPGQESILLVDDEAAIADIGQQLLDGIGYRVTAKTDSLEALEEFKRDPGRFDLIITDMTMPNMTGASLVKEILSIRPEMPIIMCTGFSENFNRNTPEGLGISALVRKPFSLKDMASVIRRVLNEKNWSHGQKQGYSTRRRHRY